MKELRIDAQKTEQKLIRFIRQQTKAAGFSKVVVGISGGLDSSLVLYLCSQALGKQNVFGLILPYKATSSEEINYAKMMARKYQVRARFIDITEQIDLYFKKFPDADKIRRGNKMARERMSVLFDQAKDLEALVAGTSNKSECLLGYGTVFGDCAFSFGVLAGLYKTQVRQLAKEVGIPAEILRLKPSAGLWPGQTDEGELGLTYAKVDRLLYYLVDKRYSDKRLVKLGFKKAYVEKVKKRIAKNVFKRNLPPIAKI
jgi:NAD+ synthase